MSEFSLVAVLIVGLLGGVHCLGMCGGIVGALTLGLHDDIRRSPVRLFPYLAAYNLGRIASYAIAGALLGALSAKALGLAPPAQVRWIVKLVTGGFMIALGLYLAGWWPGLTALERLGGKLWVRIEPFGRRFLPVNHPLKALALGLVWGWLPCGLVYSVLVTALASGSTAQGALIMAAFGLGTLPNLLAIGLFWERCHRWVQSPRVRLTAGLVVMAFGVYGMAKVGYTFAYYGWSGSCHVSA